MTSTRGSPTNNKTQEDEKFLENYIKFYENGHDFQTFIYSFQVVLG